MKPTKAEKEWMKKLEKLLCNPPSDRMGFFTIGDRFLSVYDLTKEPEINQIMDRKGVDFCIVVHELEASLGTIRSQANIHSTSG